MNVAGWLLQSVVLVVVLGVVTTIVYVRLFAARQELTKERKMINARDKADSITPAASVSLVQAPTPGWGWLSPEVIDIPFRAFRGFGSNAFPGNERAFFADVPYQVNGKELVTSSLAFELTGRHHGPRHVTRIRAVIDEQLPLPTGTVYFTVPQGDTTKNVLAFDLGSSDLDARIQDSYGAPTSRHYLDEHTIDLHPGETIGYRAVVFAPLFGHDTRYHLEFSFASGPPVVIYNDAGEPFRMVAYPRSAERGYVTAGDGYDDYAVYPCTWPSQCMRNAIGRWPFER